MSPRTDVKADLTVINFQRFNIAEMQVEEILRDFAVNPHRDLAVLLAGGNAKCLACFAHGFGKRGLTLSEPISRDVELSWVEGQTPFSETVRKAG